MQRLRQQGAALLASACPAGEGEGTGAEGAGAGSKMRALATSAAGESLESSAGAGAGMSRATMRLQDAKMMDMVCREQVSPSSKGGQGQAAFELDFD